MYFAFADEANYEQGGHADFFIYGAVFIDAAKTVGLHHAIARIRADAGFQNVDSLKFTSGGLPQHISRDKHREAKRLLLEAAHAHDVKFCAYVMLHELGRNRTQDELVKWGANTILGKFNHFLREANDYGSVLFDRMPVANPWAYFQEKFRTGLTFPTRGPMPLDRIIAYSTTLDGASHLASVADVVLGSFAYCVNEPEKDRAGREMFPLVARLMWYLRSGKQAYVRERGLVLRPKVIDHPLHKARYDDLVARLVSYIPQATAAGSGAAN